MLILYHCNVNLIYSFNFEYISIVSQSHLIGLDSGVDEVETFLDFGRDWGRGGDVVSLDPEAELVGGVLDGDDLAVGRGVGVRAVLHKSVVVLADRLQEALLLRVDVVAGLVPEITDVMSSNCYTHSYS